MNRRIENIVSEIPSYDTRLNWSFTLLEKKSASPCLFILTKIKVPESKEGCPLKKYGGETEIVIKAWPIIMNPDNTYHDRISGVEYEKNVYKNHIHSIIERDIDAPFLRYLGDDNDCSSIESLIPLISPNDIETPLKTLCLAFFVIYQIVINPRYYDKLRENMVPINFSSQTFYRTYFSYFPEQIAVYNNYKDDLKLWGIGAIILPSVKFRDFQSIIGNDIQIGCFKQIIKGLYDIFKIKLSHQDLHPGNIMIEEGTNKVLIYDWDRSYVRGQDNKLLGNDPCKRGDLCSFSQCNIFFDDGRPVDLIKILCYIAHREPGILNRYLSEGLNIKNNTRINLKTKYNTIREGLLEAGSDRCFFEYNGCSSIYKIGQNVKLEDSIVCLGETWPVIATRAGFGDVNDPLNIEQENKAEEYKQRITDTILALLSLREYHFGFTKKRSFTELSDNDEKREIKYFKSGQKNRISEEIEKLKLGIDIDKKIMNKIKKLTKYPLTDEMISDFNRIKNKEKLSISDYVILQDIYEYIKYGQPVDFELSEETSDLPELKEFSEILVENDNIKQL